MVFAAVRLVTGRWRTRIVYNGFIFTERASGALSRLRLAYFRFVLRRTWLVIVYSRLERDRYASLFPGPRIQFIRWGGSMNARREFMAQAAHQTERYVLTAGRSGRDYATLFAAMQGLEIELRVVCDLASALPPIPPGTRITVLANCYGMDYLRELAGAEAVAIPLAVGDISAGQMVMSQAFGLGRRWS